MPVDSTIIDKSTHKTARVTDQNTLATSNYDFSVPVQHNMDTVNTSFNFFKPQANKIFIITDIIVNAERGISASGSVVEIYTATDATTTTVTTQVFKFDIARQQVISLSGLNMKLNEGNFLSGKCDSETVLLTIAGFYAPI